MNPNISIPPTAADAYCVILAEQTHMWSFGDENIIDSRPQSFNPTTL